MHDAELREELAKQKKLNNELKSALTKIAKKVDVKLPKWGSDDEPTATNEPLATTEE